MTDIVKLARRLYKKIKSQNVPEEFGKGDQMDLIEDAIRQLYVISGRQALMSDDKFEYDENDYPESFADDLAQDEVEWVLLQAQVSFYKFVQASVDDQTSYTTDAMSVTHGDKPYEHIGQTIDRLEGERDRIWYSMIRYNQIGVSG